MIEKLKVDGGAAELIDLAKEMWEVSLESFEEAKDKLRIRAISKEKVSGGEIYDAVGDIAIVSYILLSEEDNNLVTIRVNKELLDYWNVTKEEVMSVSYENSKKIYRPVFISLSSFEDILIRSEKKSFMDEDYMLDDSINLFTGVIVTTKEGVNGATAIFVPGVKEIIYELLKEDYIISFTSIHEGIIHTESSLIENDLSLEDIKEILNDCIEQATLEKDILTRKVYAYHHETNEIVEVI